MDGCVGRWEEKPLKTADYSRKIFFAKSFRAANTQIQLNWMLRIIIAFYQLKIR